MLDFEMGIPISFFFSRFTVKVRMEEEFFRFGADLLIEKLLYSAQSRITSIRHSAFLPLIALLSVTKLKNVFNEGFLFSDIQKTETGRYNFLIGMN